ncbi:MAG TPA: glycosyltransferase family 39 protein [Pyrinomonadaceae bacterium]|nr:glycosyltransferase family 39 protein [Pyrinomonadaceae bacterium]
MSDANRKREWINAVRWEAVLSNAAHIPLPAILMTLVLLFVCFYDLNRVELIDLVDEGLHANAARQMVDSGDWITPRFGSILFLDKPPLTFWCQAVFIRILGATTLAARLPSAIAACSTALSLYFWAKSRGIVRVGWLAAMLYVLCPLVALGLARVAMMDSLLTLWFTLSVIGWIEGYGGNRKGYLLMAAAMGLAVMTKGVIGLLLPCASVSIWLIIRRDWAALRLVPWVAVLAIFMLLVLPWHIAAWRADGNLFLREYFMHHHVQRFLGEDFGHNQPVWYYVPNLASAMLPWSVFVPVAWWRSLRLWRSERHSLDCAFAMWGLWAAIVVLFFSLSASKLPNYVLPALPALVLLVAWRLDSVWKMRRGLYALESSILGISGSLLGILFLTTGLFGWQWRTPPASAPWLARKLGAIFNWKAQSESIDLLWHKLMPVTVLAPYWIALGALLLLGSIIILAFWRNTFKTFISALLMSLSLIVLLVHFIMPVWSDYNAAPLNGLSRSTLPALQNGETLVLYALHRPSLRYILGHNQQLIETFSPDILQSVLSSAGHGHILTRRDTTLPPLPGALQQEAEAGQWVLWRYDSNAR